MRTRKSATLLRAPSANAGFLTGRLRSRMGDEILAAPARQRWVVILAIGTLLGGCAHSNPPDNALSRAQLKHRAMECLKAAIQYRHNPVVRTAGVEALERCGTEGVAPWIRTAMLDEHPAVRFASCVAVGNLRDAAAESALRTRVDDEDASVQAAALFALHRLGYTDLSGRIPTYLLDHKDPTVRRNTAFVMGLMAEPGVIKMLARGMKDSDAGVRNYALEAMARLGNKEAKQELTFMTNAGVGADEVFAIQALAGTKDPVYADTFRYKLHTATHLETKLSAARGLGILGSDEAFTIALRALRTTRPTVADPQDPAAEQILRVRQLAAAALGAIGRIEALPALAQLIEESVDPRVQVSAAEAIVTIVEANKASDLPFTSQVKNRKR